jgi:hypothetical protein
LGLGGGGGGGRAVAGASALEPVWRRSARGAAGDKMLQDGCSSATPAIDMDGVKL